MVNDFVFIRNPLGNVITVPLPSKDFAFILPSFHRRFSQAMDTHWMGETSAE